MTLKELAMSFLQKIGVVDPYPDIDGFDISLWNEGMTLIDWPLVSTDPRKFRFCWVKCGEGTLKRGDTGAYDYAIYERQMKGAESIGLETNAYWFWYYHLPWTLNPNAPGGYDFMLLDPTAQAAAFVASMGPFANKHPLLDIEDMYVGQFLTWNDTASANKAIAFARKVNASLKKFFYEVQRLSGKKPDGYSGDWWMRKITKLLIDNGLGAEVAWMKEFNWYLADYEESDGLSVPPGLSLENILAWQYKSTVKVDPVKGIPNGDRVDLARWMKTQADFDQWAGTVVVPPVVPPEVNMSGTYKTTVEQKKRGRFVWLSSDDKEINIQALCAGVDGVMLTAASQMVSGMIPAKDGAFPIWVDRLTVPGMGVIVMDQDLFWKKEIDLNKFTDPKQRNMWNNETLRAFIENWRSVPIPPYQWDNKALDINASTGWHKIGAIVLWMATTNNVTHGSLIGGAWQQAIVDDITEPLTTLMEGGYIPKVPIYVMANHEWYRTYAQDTGWVPLNRIGTQLAGLGMMRVWGQDEAGLITDKAPMATPLASVADMWQYVPSDSYVYPITIENVNMQFHVFSYNRLRATDMFYAGKTITPATCGVWCDTPEKMKEALTGVIVIPPVDPTIDALKARITELEAQNVALEAQKAALESEKVDLTTKLAAWNSWYLSAPKG